MGSFERTLDLQQTQLDSSWLGQLNNAENENRPHFWAKTPSQLITNSIIGPGSFTVGNCADMYTSTILPSLETAQHEIIFVTCFWARSQRINELGKLLIKLSRRANTRPNRPPKLRIRLCLSSRSLIQKLFHTSSPDGYTYKPTEWVSKLGLPAPEALDGLDLRIKSLFFLPFSVMHPKFVIIDRKRALLPSCNLSYESWFEGCLPVVGPVVGHLLLCWKETWGEDDLPPIGSSATHADETISALASSHTITLLPSPHHRSPRFRPFLSTPLPPQTPLNAYINSLFSRAESYVRILTPNLTCQYVILSLLAALARGVNVTIITNRRMMILEQVLTAGIVTEICVWRFKRRYRKLLSSRSKSVSADLDLENAHPPIGTLSVGYFRPDSKYAKSHLKCTIVDGKTVVLGSGNMDRASWYTSQELGVAIDGEDFVREVWGKVDEELRRDPGREGNEADWVEWV